MLHHQRFGQASLVPGRDAGKPAVHHRAGAVGAQRPQLFAQPVEIQNVRRGVVQLRFGQFARAPVGSDFCQGQPGMTLRDYFAAAALTGYLTDRSRFDWMATVDIPQATATFCYGFADAMLTERERTEETTP